jgi:hypothetical protein
MQDTEVIMFYEHSKLAEAPDFVAVANTDLVNIVNVGAGDQVMMWDHFPGDYDISLIGGPSDSVSGAANQLVLQGSDIAWGTGRWQVPSLGFSDTTFVTASGDGGWVAFGEGSVDPVGRIIMYNATRDSITNVIQVNDLMTNANETVRGLSLNHDGTLGVARGDDAYFFSTDLRKQGRGDLPGGGAGAALHPLHADYPSLDNFDGTYHPDTHLAFIGTAEGTIDIFDAFHFNRVGRIFIRDMMVGPLAAVLPFPEDNTAFQCTSVPVLNGSGQLLGEAIDIYSDDRGDVPWPDIDTDPGTPSEDKCVVIKLFGITSSGGVVVVDVRKGDILRDHPARG